MANPEKMATTITIPMAAGKFIRKIAEEQNRTLSDIFSELTCYWLDLNYPEWNYSRDKGLAGSEVEGPKLEASGPPANDALRHNAVVETSSGEGGKGGGQ